MTSVSARSADGSAKAAPARRRRSEATVQELPDYCARPACRRPFTKVVGSGRPQAFCSEVCRRAAEKELRQARSMLAHVEALAAQLRIDIAAFSRGGFGPDSDSSAGGSGGAGSAGDGADDLAALQAATAAVHRVGGVLAFVADSEEPLARELRVLHAAVSPVIVERNS